jgi:hypothetical protein
MLMLVGTCIVVQVLEAFGSRYPSSSLFEIGLAARLRFSTKLQ